MLAAMSGRVDCVQKLIEAGANVRIPFWMIFRSLFLILLLFFLTGVDLISVDIDV